MVVRNEVCGCTSVALGLPFVVISVEWQEYTHCTYCWQDLGSRNTAILRGDGGGVSLFRLIKIDPPAIPDSITTDEEITA